MVAEVRGDHESDWAAMSQGADLLGVGTPETVRKWRRQAEVDAGSSAGLTTEGAAEIQRLKRENAGAASSERDLEDGLQLLRVELDRPHR